jgi:predicted FMN-binding regulatory protein PaiB
LPPSFKEAKKKGIVGFEIEVTAMAPKFKLGQNRSLEDRAGVAKALSAIQSDKTSSIISWMQRLKLDS